MYEPLPLRNHMLGYSKLFTRLGTFGVATTPCLTWVAGSFKERQQGSIEGRNEG